MIDSLKILLVEDNLSDVALIERQIQKVIKKPNIERAMALAEIAELINDFAPDIIISDYNLPTCSGLEVLEVAKLHGPEIPFVFVTGTLNDEEMAANTILSGATGFILKKHLQTLSSKLNPYFQKAVQIKNGFGERESQIDRSKRLVAKVGKFLENATKENMSHKEGIEKIREELKRLRTFYDNSESS